MCERYWEARWERVDGPCAKAYRLLRSIDVGPEIGSTRRPWRQERRRGKDRGENSVITAQARSSSITRSRQAGEICVAKRTTVPVTMRALIKRINLKLNPAPPS